MRSLILAVLCAFYLSNTSASDGVLEINQACAAGPGCFPDDEPGYPVRILNSGSYVLTSNLSVPALVDGITNKAANETFSNDISISLNLNGFRISSTTNCSGVPLVCSPASGASGSGVNLIALDRGATLVHNGVIQGMAYSGVICLGQCVIKDLVVSNNGAYGVLADGLVQGSYAFRNGQHGILIQSFGVVEGCTSAHNKIHGFSGAAAFSNNFAEDNDDHGFYGQPGATFNGNSSKANATGIRCNTCSAHHNTVINNTAAGFDFVGASAVYGGNLISGSPPYLLNSGSATQSAPNRCGAGLCP